MIIYFKCERVGGNVCGNDTLDVLSIRKRTRRLILPRVSFRRSGSEMPVPDNLRHSQKNSCAYRPTYTKLPMGATRY